MVNANGHSTLLSSTYACQMGIAHMVHNPTLCLHATHLLISVVVAA